MGKTGEQANHRPEGGEVDCPMLSELFSHEPGSQERKAITLVLRLSLESSVEQCFSMT